MKDSFVQRVNEKLKARGVSGRQDLEMHDARVIEAGAAAKVLATYSALYGPPSVWDVQQWLKGRMGEFGEQVQARADTVACYPEGNFITFVVEQVLSRQPITASSNMVRAGVDQFLDQENRLWEVVKADQGPNYIVRRESMPIERMLDVRRQLLRGGASARRHVTLAAVDSIPTVGGGFAHVGLGDTVSFYHAGMVRQGVVKSAGASGVRVSSGQDTYTIDPGAILNVVEKSPAALKEQDDVMRRYWSLVYPGNPDMTETLSPTSTKPIKDPRPPPGGDPLQPIQVAASAGGAARPTRRASGQLPGARVSHVTKR
jgi:hypothetical protein